MHLAIYGFLHYSVINRDGMATRKFSHLLFCPIAIIGGSFSLFSANAAKLASASEQIRNSSQPIFLVLGLPQQSGSALKKLMSDHSLTEMGISWMMINETTTKSACQSIRNEFQLTGRHWALFGAGGNLLLSGETLPASAAIKECVQKSGYKPKLRTYKEFCSKYPSHLETRAGYLRSLYLIGSKKAKVVRVEQKLLLEESREPSTHFLPDTLDQEIWPEYATQIDYSYQSGDWLKLPPISSEELTSEGIAEESRSRLFNSVLRRHFHTVISALRESPCSAVVWTHFVRMILVLNDIDASSVISSLDPFLDLVGTPSRDWIPSYCITPLKEYFTKKNEYENLAAVLGPAWEASIKPWENKQLTNKQSRKSWDYAWAQYGKPNIIPLLKSKQIGKAKKFVEELSAHPEANAKVEESIIIASSLGLSFLASEWRRVVQTPPARQGEESSSIFLNRPLLVVNSKALWTDHRLEELANKVRERGIGIKLLNREVPSFEPRMGSIDKGPISDHDLRVHLGWKDDAEQWALIGADSKQIESGMGTPQFGYIIEILEAHGLVSPLVKLDNYIKNHSSNLEAIAKKAELLREMSYRKYILSHPEQLSGSPVSDNLLPNEDIWYEYSVALQAVLNSRIWTDVDALNLVSQNFWPSYPACSQGPALVALAKTWVPQIAEALVNSPNNNNLWEAWRSLNSLQEGASLQSIVSLIVQPPNGPDFQLPPAYIIDQYSQRLREKGDWRQLENQARYFWDRLSNDEFRNAKPSIHIYNKTVWDLVILPLLESMLMQNKEKEADNLMEEWQVNLSLSDKIPSIIKLAEKVGVMGFAQRWRGAVEQVRVDHE
jgi:hypothetical protein